MSKVQKVESEDEESNFECYKQIRRKTLQVDADKEISVGDEQKYNLTIAIEPVGRRRIKTNGEIGVGNNSLNGNINVRRSSRKFRAPDRLVAHHISES